MRREKKQKNIWKEAGSGIFYLILIIGVIFLLTHFVIEKTEVSGESMYPTLESGSSILVDKITYRFKDPSRYDIVVFPFQYKEDTSFIKRIIALPGETVQILEGEIYLNGEKLEDNYGAERIRNAGLASEPITLGQDEYFVLGDNRNNSADSREPSVGLVNRESITGRALLKIWPVDKIGFID